MPFIPNKVAGDIVAAGASMGVVGVKFPQLAFAIASACAMHFATPGVVTIGPCPGLAAGPGVALGGPPLGVEPAGMAAYITARMVSKGIVGVDNARVNLAISTGISLNLLQMTVLGSVVGVGVGAGPAKVTGLVPATLGRLIWGSMLSQGLNGINSMAWATALGSAIAEYINMFAISSVVVAGPIIVPIPVPGVGMGVGGLV